MLLFLIRVLSTIAALTLDSERRMRHKWDTMRVWMRFLIFMDEDDDVGGDDFTEKTGRG